MKSISNIKELVKLCCYVVLFILILQTNSAVFQARRTMEEAQQRLKDTSQNLNAILIQTGLAADEWRKASTEQREYWSKTAKSTQLAVTHLDAMIKRTDVRINDELVPQLTASIKNTDANLAQVTTTSAEAMTKLSAGLDATLKETARASKNAADTIGDPSIKKTLDNVATSSENTAKITQHAEHAAADLETAVHRMTKPANWFTRIGAMVVDGWSKAGSIVSGWFK